MSMCWLLLLSSIWHGALLLRVLPRRTAVPEANVSVNMVRSAWTGVNDTWKHCATSGVDCTSPYQGTVCFLAKANNVAVVDPVLHEFRSTLEDGKLQIAKVKISALVAEAAHAKTSLVALEELRKENYNELVPRQADKVIATSVVENIELLWTLLTHATAAKDTLASDRFLLVGKSQAAAVKALGKAKAQVTKDLAASLETWTDRQLLVRNDEAYQAYNYVPSVHESMRTREKSLSAVLQEFCAALVVALGNARPQSIHSQQERAKQLVSSVLSLIECGFFKQDCFTAQLMSQTTGWERAFAEATGEAERQANSVTGIFDKPLTGGGPFRIFEVNPYIVTNFLSQELPQAFLGLSSCLTCKDAGGNFSKEGIKDTADRIRRTLDKTPKQWKMGGLYVQKEASRIPNLDLSYLAGGSGAQAFVCLKVGSTCLQEKVVCGCYATTGESDSLSLPSLATRDQVPVQFANGHHTRMGCTHMIFREENQASTDAGVSTLAPASSCRQKDDAQPTALSGAPLRVCMATWNLGSERQMLLKGVGWGGVDDKHGELAHDLNVILGACPANDNDVVAVTLQEGSAPEVVKVFEQIAKEAYGHEWVVAAHSFAKGNEKVVRDKDYKGYKGNDWLHEIPHLSEFSEGVHMVVLSRKSREPDAHSFGVQFSGSEKWTFASRTLGSTGFKGAAIVQLDFQHKNQVRTICFAGAHLDASNEDKRKSQAGRVTEALKTIGCPDGVWWAGDFNPRLLPHQCCPWDRLELLMHHGQKKAVVDMTRDMDPIISGSSWRESKDMKIAAAAPFSMKDWQCQGQQCSAGWHELPIGFAPTFHKIYDRTARNETEGTCRVFEPYRVPNDVRHVPKVALNDKDGQVLSLELGKKLQTWNDENRDRITSWRNTKRLAGKCDESGRDMICWDGEYNMKGCKEKGYCYHTNKKHHCPLFTDRILYTSSLTQDSDLLAMGPNSKYPIVQGCRYEAIPNVTTADHSPVVAAFTVTFGPREAAARRRDGGVKRHDEVEAKTEAFQLPFQLPQVINNFFK